MILAVGLSPAWQQILQFDCLHLGQVNRAAHAHWCASGKVLNVGRALTRLGCESLTLSLLGGLTGQAIVDEFQRAQVPLRWTPTAAATRVCTTVIDRASGGITELVENAAPASSTEIDAFLNLYRQHATSADGLVLTGSLPSGAPPALFAQLLAATTAWSVVDAAGPSLVAALAHRPLLVKPNQFELGRTVGRDLASDADTWDAMAELRLRGAQWVLVSAGAQPARLAGPTGRWLLHPPSVAVVNPIGCGDCLAAGFAAAWSRAAATAADATDEFLRALCHGLASAAENAAALLPAELDPRRVQQLAREVHVERLNQ